MPLNNPYDVTYVRNPRARILLEDGTTIPGVESVNAVNNNFYQADTFRARFAINADPKFGMNWWGDSKTQQIILDIQGSLDEGQTWNSMIIGQVDQISITLDRGLVEVEGRDLTALFIDNKTQETFLNKTSSQVAEELAARRGLQADVTATSTLVGRYYSDDHDRMNMGQFTRTTTEWNLLCSLAQHEQFDVYVTGKTLHFHPAVPEDSDPYLVVWNPELPWANAVSMHLQRSMYMAKDVVVQVRSFNSRQGRSITKFAPSGSRVASVTGGKEQLFSFVIPNLTEAEAQDIANKYRIEITKHERLFDFTMPADFILGPRMMLKLSGTNSSFDQAYHVDSVSRTMGFEEPGFSMTVKCKNHSPQTTVLSS
jgi:hypothetical protein